MNDEERQKRYHLTTDDVTYIYEHAKTPQDQQKLTMAIIDKHDSQVRELEEDIQSLKYELENLPEDTEKNDQGLL